MSKKFYCGDKDEIPEKYNRRGSRLECLRKGVGTGMYLKEKEIAEKGGNNQIQVRRDEEEDEEARERKFLKQEKRGERIDQNKDVYIKFLNNNFIAAKRTSKNSETGDIFKRLAILWKLENKINKKSKNRIIEEDDFEDA